MINICSLYCQKLWLFYWQNIYEFYEIILDWQSSNTQQPKPNIYPTLFCLYISAAMHSVHYTSVEWSFVVCHLRDFAGSFRVKAHYESHASVSVILLNYAGLNLTCLPMLMLCSWQARPFSCILLHTYIQYFYNRVLPFIIFFHRVSWQCQSQSL